ncbi:MAG TPA: cupredoxin domain-containing protein, partial [Alphaproteobacteria bacterium]|jgi:cytochrome c oxidase subunit 2|nr:cupredoxin domain-containing protein [Alphaproteobacteria bacterium]
MKVAVPLSIAGTAVAAAFALLAARAGADSAERVIQVTAKRFEYSPAEITLKKGVPVTLELKALDRLHGFSVPQLGLRADVFPDQVVTVHLVPDKVGRFEFHCDVFCGVDHEDMGGAIVVTD